MRPAPQPIVVSPPHIVNTISTSEQRHFFFSIEVATEAAKSRQCISLSLSTHHHPQNSRSRVKMNGKYELFVEWVKKHGGSVHPSLSFEPACGQGFNLVVKQEAAAIESGEPLFSVPYCLTLSYLNAICAGNDDSHYESRSQPFPHHFLDTTVDHDAVAYIFLVQQYLLGEESFWSP